MLVDTVVEEDGWTEIGLADLAERAAIAALAGVGLSPDGFEIALLGCNDTRIAELNTDFRGKPKPTNVLSWPSEERGAHSAGEKPKLPEPGDPEMPEELGDIAIALETCQREAAEASKTVADHVTHLVVHGVLHLLGYDHVEDADAALMEGLEVSILAELGIESPY